MRNKTQTAVTNMLLKKRMVRIEFTHLTFRMSLHTSSEVTVSLKL